MLEKRKERDGYPYLTQPVGWDPLVSEIMLILNLATVPSILDAAHEDRALFGLSISLSIGVHRSHSQWRDLPWRQIELKLKETRLLMEKKGRREISTGNSIPCR